MIQFDKYHWHWKNGTACVHINSNPQSNILLTHFCTSTNYFLTLSYVLKEFFQQIKKFNSWSKHFVWKDVLTVTSICLLHEVQNLQKAIHKILYAHHNIRYAHTFVLCLLGLNILCGKTCLLSQVSVSSMKFRTYRRSFIKFGTHTTTFDMPIPLYFSTS
jgi:hypothetical protein